MDRISHSTVHGRSSLNLLLHHVPELTSRPTASRSSFFFCLSLFLQKSGLKLALSFDFSSDQDLSLSAFSLGFGFREIDGLRSVVVVVKWCLVRWWVGLDCWMGFLLAWVMVAWWTNRRQRWWLVVWSVHVGFRLQDRWLDVAWSVVFLFVHLLLCLF